MYACLHLSESQEEAGESLLALARQFTPLFERAAPETVVLAMEGMERLLGSPLEMAEAIEKQAREANLSVRIAIAGNPDAAIYAARGYSGITIVPPGEEQKWLGSLDISHLPLTPETEETLRRWGIRTFAQLAALPETGVAARFGQEGVHLQRIARGEHSRPLIPWHPDLTFERHEELEHPVELLEPLLFVIGRQIHEICDALRQSSLATNEIQLVLTLEGNVENRRTLRLPVPLNIAAPLRKLIQLDLEAHPPQAAITGVRIEARPVMPQRLQTGLFLPQAPEPAKLELTLKRIEKLVGEGRVGTPEIPDTHRPGAFRIQLRQAFQTEPARQEERRQISLALRVYRPPLEAEVDLRDGAPARIKAAGIRGRVLNSAGPWRTAGDWWRNDAWSRAEWDIALSDQSLYRIYLDIREDRWFIDGRYD